MPRYYRNTQDLRDLKKIADTLKDIDVSGLNQVERYLTSYIRSNENSQDQEKQKKVNAAKILLPVLKHNGQLAFIKSTMEESAQAIQNEIESHNGQDIEYGERDFQNLSIPMGFNKLHDIMIEGERVDPSQIEAALATFMEADNFAEYHSDSPLRKVNMQIKDLANAFHATREIEDCIQQQRYISEQKPGDTMKNVWKEHSEKLVEPLFAAYGDNLSLTQAEEEMRKLPQAAGLAQEIDQLRDEYVKALTAEEKAAAEMVQYDREIADAEKKYKEKVDNYTKSEEVKWSQKEKELYWKALAELHAAHKEIQEGLAKKPPVKVEPFAEAEADRLAYEAAQNKLADTKKEYDDKAFLNKLCANAGAEKEMLTQILGNFITESIKARENERKWQVIHMTYKHYQELFHDDPVIMNFLIGTEEKAMEGLRKLEKEYNVKDDPEKQNLYDLAISSRSTIMKLMDNKMEEIFNYDGGVDQKTYMAELEKKLSENDLNARRDFDKNNQIKRAYKGYRNTKQKLEELSEKANSVTDENEAEEIRKQIKKQMDLNADYLQKLMVVGIKDPDMVKDAVEYADKKYYSSEIQIGDAEKFEDAARKKAIKSREKAKKLKDAIEVCKKSKFIMSYKDIETFINILESENPDYSKLPQDRQVFQNAYDRKKENIINERDRAKEEAQHKLSELRTKKQNTEKVLKEKKSEKILDKMTEKAMQKQKLAEEYHKLDRKNTLMKGLIPKTKEFMRPHYTNFHEEYNKVPKDKTGEAYKRIYEEIEKYRNDFGKCMRDDYARNPEGKNSTEFKRIRTALNAFGQTREEFDKLSIAQIQGKLDELKDAADDYKRLKLQEKRLIWSHQRRFRLDYADRISKFADHEKEWSLPILQRNDEKNVTKGINDTYKEYEKFNPEGMQSKIGGGEEPKEDKQVLGDIRRRQSAERIEKITNAINEKAEQIDHKMEQAVAEIGFSFERNDQKLAIALCKLDTLKQMKEGLRNYTNLSEEGVNNHLKKVDLLLKDESFNKYIERKMKPGNEGDKYRGMAERMDCKKLPVGEGGEKILELRDITEMRHEMKKQGVGRKEYLEAVKTGNASKEIELNRKKDMKDLREKKKDGEDSKGIANELIENKPVKPGKKIKPAKKPFQL
ncbi:MAG: hypothetical protein K6E75_11720 [Lachnospiraceae bacterium]|nr:hypothetical protein [Lachnospiraceae bacterium]